MRTPVVLLFDIDGTLITTGGAARGALEGALAEFLGLPGYTTSFSFGGMTDRAILRIALTEAGHEPTDARIDAALALYLDRLDGALAAATVYSAHAGVFDVLRGVSGRPDVAVGLGTGNVEVGARKKLAPLDLNAPFAFGGFGCDHELRPRLIHAGAARGAARLGVPLDACRVVVIGDTVRDVDAAHANGFACMAVATGGDTRATLDGTSAAWIVDSLADAGVVDALLYG